MTPTLAIASQKGGVGKTTIAVNLAYALSARGWKTLMIDADPQGGVAASISKKARRAPGVYDLLLGKKSDSDVAQPDALILSTRLPELSLLPSGSAEATVEFLENIPDYFEFVRQLRRLFSNLMTKVPLDVIVVDTPVLASPITRAVGAVASHLLIPEQAEPLSQRGISAALRFAASLKNDDPDGAELAGILLTMTDPDDPDSLDFQSEFRMLLPSDFVLDTTIPRDSDFFRASRAGVPVALLRRKPPAAALTFDQLAAELETRLDLEIEPETYDLTENNDFTRLMD